MLRGILARALRPRAGAAAGAGAGAGAGGACQRRVSVEAGDLREGTLLELPGERGLWRLVSRQLSRTAQGRALVQCELRGLTGPAAGASRALRFRADEAVETAALDSPARHTVLYALRGGEALAIMHEATYEQAELPRAALPPGADRFLFDGITLTIEAHNGAPALVALPSRVAARVLAVDEGAGDSSHSASVLPEATPPPPPGGGPAGATPLKVRVPKFIKVGDRVILDPADGKYLAREA